MTVNGILVKVRLLIAKGELQPLGELAGQSNPVALQEQPAGTLLLEGNHQIDGDNTRTHTLSSEALQGFVFIAMPDGGSPSWGVPDAGREAPMDGGSDHAKGRPPVNAAAAKRPPSNAAERLPVKSGRKVVLLKVSDIDWIDAAHNYATLHVGKQSHLLRGTLHSVALRLPQGKFVRISRSTIVQIDRIKELELLASGDCRVTLHDGAKLTLSRRHRAKFQKMGLL